jgi:peptide/bleomycin uptake transporter
MYFNIGRIVYLQTDVIFPYVLLAPTIIAGEITLGAMNQIVHASANLVSVSRQLVEHDRRTDLDLSATAGV